MGPADITINSSLCISNSTRWISINTYSAKANKTYKLDIVTKYVSYLTLNLSRIADALRVYMCQMIISLVQGAVMQRNTRDALYHTYHTMYTKVSVSVIN